MWLAFQNNYGQIVSVAIMDYDTDACGQYGDWATHGWWNINPGDSQTVVWTTNEYVNFYAEAQDGSATWSDPNGPVVYVHPEQFDSCYNIGATGDWTTVNMAQADVGWPPGAPFTHTVNLSP